MAEIKATTTLDTSGKCCPMPMVETTKAIKALAPGDILEIVATDVGTRRDIPSWCERSGHTLLSMTEQDKVLGYCGRTACGGVRGAAGPRRRGPGRATMRASRP